MDKREVEKALGQIAQARSAWGTAQAKFNADVEFMMARLLREAAVHRMSVEHVAKASGLSVTRVRAMLRSLGMDPRKGKAMMAKAAAEALAENAALLGVEPSEMDLMSPLAYLPMGRQMRDELQSRAVRQGVTDLPEDLLARVGHIIAEETACGYCEGTCESCTDTAQRIINVVQGAQA